MTSGGGGRNNGERMLREAENLACPFCFCISYLALPGVLGWEKLESASKLDLAELEVSV